MSIQTTFLYEMSLKKIGPWQTNAASSNFIKWEIQSINHFSWLRFVSEKCASDKNGKIKYHLSVANQWDILYFRFCLKFQDQIFALSFFEESSIPQCKASFDLSQARNTNMCIFNIFNAKEIACNKTIGNTNNVVLALNCIDWKQQIDR